MSQLLNFCPALLDLAHLLRTKLFFLKSVWTSELVETLPYYIEDQLWIICLKEDLGFEEQGDKTFVSSLVVSVLQKLVEASNGTFEYCQDTFTGNIICFCMDRHHRFCINLSHYKSLPAICQELASGTCAEPSSSNQHNQHIKRVIETLLSASNTPAPGFEDDVYSTVPSPPPPPPPRPSPTNTPPTA